MHAVLVAPEIPQNTGSIGRLCLATGTTLHLIDPLGFTIDDRHLRRAGLDYWPHVRCARHASWEAFLAARPAGRLLCFSARASRSYTTVRFREDDLLVFGSESRGLPAAIRAAHAEATFGIPLASEHVRSLNLATAVARPELHARLVKLGFRQVVDLDWWDKTSIDGVTVTAVPARHAVPENGYVVESDRVQVYVAGDTRYFPELVDVATRFPHLDAALLPVGGERYLGFGREMGPADAARAAALLGPPERVIPIGYGKRGGFPLRWFARHPAERFVEECKKRGIEAKRIVVLETGESWHYYK